MLNFSLSGQEKLNYLVNGVPLDSLNVEYVQINGETKPFSNKVTVELDFGQSTSWWKGTNIKITDSKGKAVVLNSMIDALNFMIGNGYEYINSFYQSTNIVSGTVYFYAFGRG